MTKLRVIIGHGTASEVYQYTGAQGEFRNIVIGPKGLWAVLPKTHAMGQPPHLLALPGQQVPKFQAPTGTTATGLKLFLDVNTYQENLVKLNGRQVGERMEYPNCKVTGIAPATEAGKIFVEVSDPSNPSLKSITADQVIIASGIGPQKQLQDVKIPVEGKPDENLGYKQIEEGIDFLTHSDKLGDTVVVYGGGATGAWVAAEVYDHMKRKGKEADWCWMAQPGGSGFSKSELPGDRNALILAQQKHQVRYEIKKAVYRAKGGTRAAKDDLPALPDHPMVELTLKNTDGFEFRYLVDQVIFCIGGNPAAKSGAIGALVKGKLLEELEPLKDHNRMVSDGAGTLAWHTPTNSLIIVGAAAFNGIQNDEAKIKKDLQAAPMGFLPPNAQVPDGIAVAISTIEALNAYMPVSGGQARTYVISNKITAERTSESQPVRGSPNPIAGQTRDHHSNFDWNINFNTSNRTQIAAYIAATSDTDAFTANLQVAMIIHLRSKNNFGLSEDQVDYVMKSIADSVNHVRKKVPAFDKIRARKEHRDDLKQPGAADEVLMYYLDMCTSKETWKLRWASQQINC